MAGETLTPPLDGLVCSLVAEPRSPCPPRFAAPWSRGAGDGIGLSGHKNEYKAGVRIGNWVEEMFGHEAKLIKESKGDTLKDFIKTMEAAQTAVAMSKDEAQNTKRIEPKMGEPGYMLFSHGPTFNEKFAASMSALHFSDPAQRDFGAASNDRVHKSFFYGSKHIDQYVPKVNPNPRMQLTMSKRQGWAEQMGQAGPVDLDMYNTVHKVTYPPK